MPAALDRTRVRRHLEGFDFEPLFIEELGWDHGGTDTEVTVAGRSYALKAIAHKRGMVAYLHQADAGEELPDYPTRQKIEKSVAKTAHEHIIIYSDAARSSQYWQWVKREPGRPDRSRQHIYHVGQAGEALIQKLEHLAFTLEEEEDLSIVDVSGRVRAAFNVEKVTKKFYDRFKKEHDAFLGLIEGIETLTNREWYASLMMNRMMFIYFIQKRRFLDGDPDYLRNRLERMQQERGKDSFLRFYRLFLLRLFHEGLGQPAADRAPEITGFLGRVPYLNGGLFDVHDLERDNPHIQIPDAAFQRIFDFFDAYQWHLDDRPLHDDNEINPDVLGYIFEKYINQKQMGAYYTKEDITGYISRNTIIPFLFDQAKKECPIAFKPDGGVWRLLRDDPDRYFQDAVRHGISYDIFGKQDLGERRDLPPEIAAGVDDVSERGNWNAPALAEYALPTETWREHVARRQHYEEVRAKLFRGEVTSINDLITYNLDIEKLAQDVISQSEGPELVRAFWNAITKISILDPTCGSGAFLFAALSILEPLYVTCLEAMRGFLDDLDRSDRKHHPETMSDFRKVLERIGEHASERYIILKSIIIGNLYGVDIMEEAVEICKLRLFLKLVAQLGSYDQIEPLPDIDFNIRAGNTLVGFASLYQVKRALGGDLVKQLALPDMEERAENADRAFQRFRMMQTEHGMNAEEFSETKVELGVRLQELRDELDRYLAKDCGVNTSEITAFERWRESHHPFHWFVEYYGIMKGGGFDVIIGNPPYVEYSKVRGQYQVSNFETTSCGNLYVFVMERSMNLKTKYGKVGLIVPLSFVCTKRMDLARALIENGSTWISSFDIRPSSLFEGVTQRLAIVLTGAANSTPVTCFTAGYRRWMAEERSTLFQGLEYIDISDVAQEFLSILKFSTELDKSILAKIGPTRLSNYVDKTASEFFVHRIVRYFVKALTFVPEFIDENQNRGKSVDYKSFKFGNSERTIICALLNSSLFYWFWRANSDGFHCGYGDVYAMPYQSSISTEVRQDIERLHECLMREMREHSTIKRVTTKKGSIAYQEFNVKRCKHFVDEIDNAFSHAYSFTGKELDYIVNYDIKYRIGRGDLSSKYDA